MCLMFGGGQMLGGGTVQRAPGKTKETATATQDLVVVSMVCHYEMVPREASNATQLVKARHTTHHPDVQRKRPALRPLPRIPPPTTGQQQATHQPSPPPPPPPTQTPRSISHPQQLHITPH